MAVQRLAVLLPAEEAWEAGGGLATNVNDESKTMPGGFLDPGLPSTPLEPVTAKENSRGSQTKGGYIKAPVTENSVDSSRGSGVSNDAY